MDVTIVIPTYNRIDKLLETLLALNKQTYKLFSVLVMDDGSTDETSLSIESEKKRFNYPIKYIKQQNGGASNAINNALKDITNGLVILIDNDIITSHDTISKHVQFHEKHPTSLLSGAAEIDPSTIKTDIELYKYAVDKKWEKQNKTSEGPLLVNFDNFVITTANMSFSKDTFNKIGGFDERLRDGYDFEFGIRALALGVPSYFDVDIKTIHNDPFTLTYYAKRQRCYMKSKEQIFIQNPDYKKYFRQNFEQLVPPYKKLVYSILERKNVVDFIENSRYMLVFPKKIRYKIYGMTIAAISLSKNEI